MKPNLVYVFADQLRYDALSCNGDDKAITPHIDELSSESLNLDNCVSNHPVCAPYRASLFTGKYTTSTGMVINEIRMNPNHRCIGHILKENGYETAYIGKWHLYAAQFNNHYSVRNSFVPKGENRLGFDDLFAHYNFHHEYYAPKAYYHLDDRTKHYVDGYEPDYMSEYAIREIERLSRNDKPFALFLSLGTPHDPWNENNVPKQYLDLYKDTAFDLPVNYESKNDRHADMWARLSKKERKKLLDYKKVYYAMVSNLDDNIGKINEYLKASNLLDTTYFVFTSDHGEMFGSHGRRAKNIFYDEAVRVPFFIKGRDIIKGKKDFCFSSVDIMPTLLRLLGLDYPAEVEGKDLSDCFVSDEDNEEGSLLMGTGPTALYGNGYERRGYRNKRYTYAIYRKDKEEFLFNNLCDPYQMHNLANDPDFQTIKNEMKSIMFEKMNDIHDDFNENLYYKKHWIRHRVIKKTATLK